MLDATVLDAAVLDPARVQPSGMQVMRELLDDGGRRRWGLVQTRCCVARVVPRDPDAEARMMRSLHSTVPCDVHQSVVMRADALPVAELRANPDRYRVSPHTVTPSQCSYTG